MKIIYKYQGPVQNTPSLSKRLSFKSFVQKLSVRMILSGQYFSLILNDISSEKKSFCPSNIVIKDE